MIRRTSGKCAAVVTRSKSRGTSARPSFQSSVLPPMPQSSPRRVGARSCARRTGGGTSIALTVESVPGPFRDVQTIRHVLCRVVVTSHRGSRRPREVIVQHAPEALVARKPGVFQCPIEACDRPLVHLLVRAVSAVNPDDRGLITIP